MVAPPSVGSPLGHFTPTINHSWDISTSGDLTFEMFCRLYFHSEIFISEDETDLTSASYTRCVSRGCDKYSWPRKFFTYCVLQILNKPALQFKDRRFFGNNLICSSFSFFDIIVWSNTLGFNSCKHNTNEFLHRFWFREKLAGVKFRLNQKSMKTYETIQI